MAAYCVKCKGKRQMQGARPTVLKNRKRVTHATTGNCSTCGTKMYRIEK